MRVHILRGVVIEGEPCRPGQTVEVGEALAAALVRTGRAALVSPLPSADAGGRETATAPAYETAVAPVEPVETEPVETTPVEPVETWLPDRLTAIKGIGQRTQEVLNAAGVWTFQQLADADPDALAAALDGSSPAQVRRWQADSVGFLG